MNPEDEVTRLLRDHAERKKEEPDNTDTASELIREYLGEERLKKKKSARARAAEEFPTSVVSDGS